MNPRLSVPWHRLPGEARWLAAPGAQAGMVVGTAASGQPAVVRIFRRRPTSVAIVGSDAVARLFVARALAHGARVAVHTADPARWGALAVSPDAPTPPGSNALVPPGSNAPAPPGPDALAAARPDALAPPRPDAPVPPPGTPYQPSLVVDDIATGATGAPGALPIPRDCGPWQAAMALHRTLSPPAAGSLRGCDLVVLQRQPVDAVELVRASTGLSSQDARWLPDLPDHVIALVSGGRLRYAQVHLA